MIRAVGFDFGNVIGIFDTPEWFKFITDNRANCRDPRELFSGSLLQLIKDFDLGKMTSIDYYSKVRLAYHLNVTMKEFYDKLGGILSIDWEMVKIINELKSAGVMTFLITNMNPYHAEYIRKNYPEVFASFDYCMVSCEERIAKPEDEAFIRPLEILGLNSRECLFFDDSYTNIEKACSLGYKGWYYNVVDEYFCQNGKLDGERQKLKNFIELLKERELLPRF